MASRLEGAGHGSATIVVFRHEGTRLAHAVCGVNSNGSVGWVDPQVGRVSKASMYRYEGDYFQSITVNPEFVPVDPPADHPTAISLDF